MSTISHINRQEALFNPEKVFETPVSLASEPGLTLGEKLAALERWAFDVEQRLKAGGEGMPTAATATDDAELLREIGKTELWLKQPSHPESP